jgi:hypothetical protein
MREAMAAASRNAGEGNAACIIARAITDIFDSLQGEK